jgi:hypothetical protein
MGGQLVSTSVGGPILQKNIVYIERGAYAELQRQRCKKLQPSQQHSVLDSEKLKKTLDFSVVVVYGAVTYIYIGLVTGICMYIYTYLLALLLKSGKNY